MRILAITGSIGMGKTTTARLFAEQGIPVFDADKTVHALYARGGAAVAAISAKWPHVIEAGAVSRTKLAAHLAVHKQDFAALEKIVHPLVGAARKTWVEEQRKAGAEMVLFDIPLLLEGKNKSQVDTVIVVSAPEAVQRARVLQRPGMSKEKLDQILSRQMPDAEKRKRADYIITTDQGEEDARLQVGAVLRHIQENLIRQQANRQNRQ
jgi:dephospho-CoA kinase